MPKGVYPHTHLKPRVYPPEVVELVRSLYLDIGMTVREVQIAIGKGYKAQRIIERYIGQRRRAAIRDQTGHRNKAWKGDALGYAAAHWRVVAARGAASRLSCVDCGESADEWSYVGGCPREIRDLARGCPYSPDVNRYSPRCLRCHRAFDYKGRRSNGQFVSTEEVMSDV